MNLNETSHKVGQRVRSVFSDEREGVVIESDATHSFIEFEDEDGGVPFTHRKWLPTRHWIAA